MQAMGMGLEEQMERLGGMKTGHTWDANDDLWRAGHKELVKGLREVLKADRGVHHAWLFGSVALGADGPGQTVEVAVDMEPDRLMQGQLKQALETATGRKVDLFVLRDLEPEDWEGRRRIS